jgi:DNA-binding MarR family transcriptional regulator
MVREPSVRIVLPTDKSKGLDLRTLPGHYVRRIQQLVVAMFMQEVAELNITPVQYSMLQTICNEPGIDQKTLAYTIGYDTATIAGVLDRLEARGLVVRTVSPHDKRVRLLNATEQGAEMLRAVVPRMLSSQERFLEPLSKVERLEFMRLMKVLVDANAELSNVPTKG